jgi:hypothetical protein
MKLSWRDGTTHIVLTGTEVIDKLVALISPPRMRLVRYYGIFAPRAKLRPLVVPAPLNHLRHVTTTGARTPRPASERGWIGLAFSNEYSQSMSAGIDGARRSSSSSTVCSMPNAEASPWFSVLTRLCE